MCDSDNLTNSMARLYGDVRRLDTSIENMEKAALFNKADHAEIVVKNVRISLMHIVLTMHTMKNEIERLQGKEVQPCTLP